MSISLAVPNDIIEIMELVKSCIIDLEAHKIYQWNKNYPTVDHFEGDIENKSLYIFKDGGVNQGIITINETQPLEYKKLNWLINDSRVMVIHRLAVKPIFQRQGIGQRLMNFAENFAFNNDYDSIRLDAYSGNPRAIKFYENRGYKKIGQVFFPGRTLPFYCYEKIVR
ncbi:GNAT family N-acetyltransferase [Halocella sp. SP3-1]|uniref:GNAT family N-acetyltransferase n=1 Tax=Halocella sp. SP3-1 TaxID=2382161 RepID=UPI000F74F1D9|nr:GNAT family N-acetyltransferase [Halocella sp. SP3-1]AZO95148.1 GNAT family N-acetyltransferase [Halocella sp. SP3-1]